MECGSMSMWRQVAEVGGVEWLPGVEYLYQNSTTTLDFTAWGVCNEQSSLHNEQFCVICKERVSYVHSTRYIVLLVTIAIFIAPAISVPC